MFRKGLAVAVILLFMGVAVAPTINASVVNDSLVDFEVEFCGLGKRHTVQLTKQEANELEYFLDDIERQLSEDITTDEAELIVKDAIVKLDSYGLFGQIGIKQVESLILSKYLSEKSIYSEHLNNPFSSPSNRDGIGGVLGLVVGQNDGMFLTIPNFIALSAWFGIFGVPFFISFMLMMASGGGGFLAFLVIRFIEVTNQLLDQLFQHSGIYAPSNIYLNGQEGWLAFVGFGFEFINGSLYGQLNTPPPFISPAVRGFTGIKIKISDEPRDFFYIGCALSVGIGNQ